eukprot:COSAG02_NODE_1288_length_13447_cov_17.387549_10_plen_749_part_00
MLAAAQSDLERTRQALTKQTARADLEQRKFTVLANKLGILPASNLRPSESGGGEQDTRRGAAVKRAREPAAPTVSPAHSACSSVDRVRQTRNEIDGDPRPCVVRRLDDPPSNAPTTADSSNGPASSAPASELLRARAGLSGDPFPAASRPGQSAPSNMQRLIDAGLLPRATRVFQGQGAQLARDQNAQASGHRCMLAYGLPSGGGNCYLSFSDQTYFAQIYHKMLLKVADPSVKLQPHVGLDDICFYEQLYLPCSWYFDVEEEEAGRPLPSLSEQMIAAIREAALANGITNIGRCSVTDGSRTSKDKCGYKNSLHLVFRNSPVCPHPTSNAAAPDYAPLLAAQHVHSRMDVKDSKGALQPDIGVYTTRRNMRLIGSCKVGQPVPLVPVDAFPVSSGFSIQFWVDWLKSSKPEDLLLYMVSRDDGVTEPNWQTQLSASGPRRINGAADNWDVLGPAPGGVMSQTAAGLSPVTDNRMPPLKAWVKTHTDDDDIDDHAQVRKSPRSRSDSASHSNTRHHTDPRGGSRQDSSRDRDRDSVRGRVGSGGRSSRWSRGSRNSGRDNHSGQSHHASIDSDRRSSGNSNTSNNRGACSSLSAGSRGHRSMTRQALDAPSPSRIRTSAGVGSGNGAGRVSQRSGARSCQQATQPLHVTSLNPVQQRIMRHQNRNGVVRNQSVRAEMAGYENHDLKKYADAMCMSPSSRAHFVQECSRHRAAVPAGCTTDGLPPAGPPPTPQGYWETSIPESETQDLD